MEAAEAAINAAKNGKTVPMHTFTGTVEHALAHIEEAAVHGLPEEQQRFYAIKLFERDDKVLEQLKLSEPILSHIETDIKAAEKEMDAEDLEPRLHHLPLLRGTHLCCARWPQARARLCHRGHGGPQAGRVRAHPHLPGSRGQQDR